MITLQDIDRALALMVEMNDLHTKQGERLARLYSWLISERAKLRRERKAQNRREHGLES